MLRVSRIQDCMQAGHVPHLGRIHLTATAGCVRLRTAAACKSIQTQHMLGGEPHMSQARTVQAWLRITGQLPMQLHGTVGALTARCSRRLCQ